MSDEQKEEQACLYVLGALSIPENLEFENLLTSDPGLRGLLGELQTNLAAWAAIAPAHSPRPELKQQVLACISELESSWAMGPRPAPIFEPGGFPYWLPWSLAACLAVLCMVLMNENQSPQQGEAQSSQQATDQSRKERDDLQAHIAQREPDFAQMRVAMLQSLSENSPKGLAVSVWDSGDGSGLLMAENLAQLPTNQNYQLWFIDKQNHPVNGGIFSADEKGRARFQFKLAAQPANLDKFAVSVEPKGGVSEPTGPIILLGQPTF